MGGKGSGRRRVSYKRTLIEIYRLLEEIEDDLGATNATMRVLMQRLLYYTKTGSKRR
jgi:hypothetical protein